MHKAVRNAIRLLDRIKDYEQRVLKHSGALCREDHEALRDALGLMAQGAHALRAAHRRGAVGVPRGWRAGRGSAVAAGPAERSRQKHGVEHRRAERRDLKPGADADPADIHRICAHELDPTALSAMM